MEPDNHGRNNENDPHEFPDAPEDDDFVDFEGAEDEAPEAVQALISGPNWVFPDLVRIQSSNATSLPPNVQSIDSAASNHHPSRILDPPDVSLLSCNASSSKPKPNQTLDLCSSIVTSSNSVFNNNTGKPATVGASNNGPTTSVSSPSSGSSSLSAVISDGPILGSNSSHSSSPSLSAGAFMSQAKAADEGPMKGNHHHHHFYSNPSTSSNGIVTPELKIRALQLEKLQLQEQLREKEKQLAEHSETRLEEAIGKKIEKSLENIVGAALSDLTYRVERLEKKSVPIANGGTSTVRMTDGSPSMTSNDQTFLLQQMFQRFKMEQQQERREMLQTLSEILSHALEKVNSLKQQK